MKMPQPGKVAFAVFEGSPKEATDAANAFLEEHDAQKYPVTNTMMNYNVVGETLTLSILLVIQGPPPGRPDLSVARMAPRNGDVH